MVAWDGTTSPLRGLTWSQTVGRVGGEGVRSRQFFPGRNRWSFLTPSPHNTLPTFVNILMERAGYQGAGLGRWRGGVALRKGGPAQKKKARAVVRGGPFLPPQTEERRQAGPPPSLNHRLREPCVGESADACKKIRNSLTGPDFG